MSIRNSPRREVKAAVFDDEVEEEAPVEASVHLASYYKTLSATSPLKTALSAAAEAAAAELEAGGSVVSTESLHHSRIEASLKGREEDPSLPHWHAAPSAFAPSSTEVVRRSPNASGLSPGSSAANVGGLSEIPAIPPRDQSYRDNSHDHWQQGITSPRTREGKSSSRTQHPATSQVFPSSRGGTQAARSPPRTPTTAAAVDEGNVFYTSSARMVRVGRSPTKPPNETSPRDADKTHISALSAAICSCSSISSVPHPSTERQLFNDEKGSATDSLSTSQLKNSKGPAPAQSGSLLVPNTIECCDRHGCVRTPGGWNLRPLTPEATTTPAAASSADERYCTPPSTGYPPTGATRPGSAEAEAERRVEWAAKRVFLIICHLQMAFRERYGTDPPPPQPVTAAEWRRTAAGQRGAMTSERRTGESSARQHQDPTASPPPQPDVSLQEQRAFDAMVEQLEMKENELTRVVVHFVQTLSIQALRNINKGRYSPAWETLQVLESYTKPHAGIHLKDSAVLPQGGIVFVPFYPSMKADQEERRRVEAIVENNRGLYHFKLREFDLARAHLKHAVDLEVGLNAPTIGITYFNLAQAERELRGREDDGLQHLNLAEDAVEQRVYSNKCLLNQLQHHTSSNVPPSRLAEIATRESEHNGLTEGQRELVKVWLQWREAVCLLSYLKQEHGNWLGSLGHFKKAIAQYDQGIRWLTSISRLSPEEVQRLEVLRHSIAECRKALRFQQRRPVSVARSGSPRKRTHRSHSATVNRTVVTTVLPRHVEIIDASLAATVLKKTGGHGYPVAGAGSKPRAHRLDHLDLDAEMSEDSWTGAPEATEARIPRASRCSEPRLSTAADSRTQSVSGAPLKNTRTTAQGRLRTSAYASQNSRSTSASHHPKPRSAVSLRHGAAPAVAPPPSAVAGTAGGGLSALQRVRLRQQQRERRLYGSTTTVAKQDAGSPGLHSTPLKGQEAGVCVKEEEVAVPPSSRAASHSQPHHPAASQMPPRPHGPGHHAATTCPSDTTATATTTTTTSSAVDLEPQPLKVHPAAEEMKPTESWRQYHQHEVEEMGLSPLRDDQLLQRRERTSRKQLDRRAPVSFIQAITLLQSILRGRMSAMLTVVRRNLRSMAWSALSLRSVHSSGEFTTSSSSGVFLFPTPSQNESQLQMFRGSLPVGRSLPSASSHVLSAGKERPSFCDPPACFGRDNVRCSADVDTFLRRQSSKVCAGFGSFDSLSSAGPSPAVAEEKNGVEPLLDGTQKPTPSYGPVVVGTMEVLQANDPEGVESHTEDGGKVESAHGFNAKAEKSVEEVVASLRRRERTRRPQPSHFPSSYEDEEDPEFGQSAIPSSAHPFLVETPAPSYEFTLEEVQEARQANDEEQSVATTLKHTELAEDEDEAESEGREELGHTRAGSQPPPDSATAGVEGVDLTRSGTAATIGMEAEEGCCPSDPRKSVQTTEITGPPSVHVLEVKAPLEAPFEEGTEKVPSDEEASHSAHGAAASQTTTLPEASEEGRENTHDAVGTAMRVESRERSPITHVSEEERPAMATDRQTTLEIRVMPSSLDRSESSPVPEATRGRSVPTGDEASEKITLTSQCVSPSQPHVNSSTSSSSTSGANHPPASRESRSSPSCQTTSSTTSAEESDTASPKQAGEALETESQPRRRTSKTRMDTAMVSRSISKLCAEVGRCLDELAAHSRSASGTAAAAVTPEPSPTPPARVSPPNISSVDPSLQRSASSSLSDFRSVMKSLLAAPDEMGLAEPELWSGRLQEKSVEGADNGLINTQRTVSVHSTTIVVEDVVRSTPSSTARERVRTGSSSPDATEASHSPRAPGTTPSETSRPADVTAGSAHRVASITGYRRVDSPPSARLSLRPPVHPSTKDLRLLSLFKMTLGSGRSRTESDLEVGYRAQDHEGHLSRDRAFYFTEPSGVETSSRSPSEGPLTHSVTSQEGRCRKKIFKFVSPSRSSTAPYPEDSTASTPPSPPPPSHDTVGSSAWCPPPPPVDSRFGFVFTAAAAPTNVSSSATASVDSSVVTREGESRHSLAQRASSAELTLPFHVEDTR